MTAAVDHIGHSAAARVYNIVSRGVCVRRFVVFVADAN